jgi:hypothetical protein
LKALIVLFSDKRISNKNMKNVLHAREPDFILRVAQRALHFACRLLPI